MNVLSFLEVILNCFWKDLFKGSLQGSAEKCVLLGRTLEIPARPLWACIYTMSFTNVCKGQTCALL